MEHLALPESEEIRVLMEIKENIERSLDVLTGIKSIELGNEDRQALVDFLTSQNLHVMDGYMKTFGFKNDERFY